MKSRIYIVVTALTLPLMADTAEVECQVRRGDYAQALAAVDTADESPEAMYWKGRALVGMRRLPMAALTFSKVPPEHEFYPYAAKGIIYCAWESGYINFVEAVAPLTISSDEEIAALATAALAEFQLRHTQGGDTASLDELRRLSRKHPEWLPTLQLLEIENLRREGSFDEAVALCRDIESDNTRDLATRHRARLALAEIYYDREKNAAATSPGKEEGEQQAEGMGEETLLQFISANPESPLLQEAFRRLALHRAFVTSKYTARRLREWVEDITKPKRAALALLMQQRAAFAGKDDTAGATLANAAVPISTEMAARTVILEQVRVLLARGEKQQAELFLNLLPTDMGGYRQFFYASTLAPESPEAKEAYLLSAETAPGELLPAAYSNALFCAYRGGDDATVRSLMQENYPRPVRRALLLTYAYLLQKDKPSQALQTLEELADLEPTPAQQTEALLLRSGINLENDPTGTLAELLEVPEKTTDFWTDAQLLRYYRLQLEAVDNLTGDADAPGIERVRAILADCKRPAVTAEMLFNLAARLSASGDYTEALLQLEKIVSLADTTDTKARALLLAAEASAKIGSQEALSKSIDLFEQCARLSSPYADKADIHRARVLSWVNRADEARQLLTAVIRREESLSTKDRALAYTALAETYSMDGTEAGNNAALQYSTRMLQIPGLPTDWHTRGKMLHATLCARYGHSEEALADYLELLASNPDTVKDFTKARWFVLAYAGSGAIYRYLQLNRPNEAASLAERVADCFSHHPSPETAAEQSRLFSNWATDIRRNYY